MAKGYTLDFEYVLYNVSYQNMVLYSSVLQMDGSEEKQKKPDENIKADDPKNKDKINSILFG